MKILMWTCITLNVVTMPVNIALQQAGGVVANAIGIFACLVYLWERP